MRWPGDPRAAFGSFVSAWSALSGDPEVRDLVGRNVAALIKALQQGGRPSKSLTLEQAADTAHRGLPPVRICCALGDDRAEDRGTPGARWKEVDLDAGTVAVYRAVRATADTRRRRSPARAVAAATGRTGAL